mgnify:CR=1 FL=1|jgi:hypothetical protein
MYNITFRFRVDKSIKRKTSFWFDSKKFPVKYDEKGTSSLNLNIDSGKHRIIIKHTERFVNVFVFLISWFISLLGGVLGDIQSILNFYKCDQTFEVIQDGVIEIKFLAYRRKKERSNNYQPIFFESDCMHNTIVKENSIILGDLLAIPIIALMVIFVIGFILMFNILV